MIITDKDGNVHSIKIERITFGVINTLLGVIELKIYFRDNGYSLSINFASKEAAESVLKQIDTRMENTLVDYTEQAKLAEEPVPTHSPFGTGASPLTTFSDAIAEKIKNIPNCTTYDEIRNYVTQIFIDAFGKNGEQEANQLIVNALYQALYYRDTYNINNAI